MIKKIFYRFDRKIFHYYLQVLRFLRISMPFHSIWTKDGLSIVDDWQLIEFFDHYRFHRLNRPAVLWADGTREWRVNGKKHRLDGPAVEWQNRTREWWVDDKRHRLDGPAFEWPDGRKEWWVDGKKINTEEVEMWLEENKIDLQTTEDQIAFKLRFIN